nr:MAG TPA: hypothetical protein [Caudoviricetes sp.]
MTLSGGKAFFILCLCKSYFLSKLTNIMRSISTEDLFSRKSSMTNQRGVNLRILRLLRNGLRARQRGLRTHIQRLSILEN